MLIYLSLLDQCFLCQGKWWVWSIDNLFCGCGNCIVVCRCGLWSLKIFFIRLFGSDAVTYQGNHTPSVDEEASNLGESLLLSSTFRNEGPSNIQNGTLTIYVPIRSSTTGDNYFYYPAKLVCITSVY